MAGRVSFIKGHIGCFDGDFAAMRHGIAGVDHQIHQNLLNLGGVYFYRSQTRGQGCFEIYIFANHAAKHFVKIGDNLIEVYDLRFNNLFAAKGQ